MKKSVTPPQRHISVLSPKLGYGLVGTVEAPRCPPWLYWVRASPMVLSVVTLLLLVVSLVVSFTVGDVIAIVCVGIFTISAIMLCCSIIANSHLTDQHSEPATVDIPDEYSYILDKLRTTKMVMDLDVPGALSSYNDCLASLYAAVLGRRRYEDVSALIDFLHEAVTDPTIRPDNSRSTMLEWIDSRG